MNLKFNSEIWSKQRSKIFDWAQSKWCEIQGFVIKTHIILIKVLMCPYY